MDTSSEEVIYDNDECIDYLFLVFQEDTAASKLADVPFVEIQALREKLGTKKCVGVLEVTIHP